MRLPGVIGLLLGTATLAGCAGTSGVSDTLTAGTLDKRKSGVVVLKADILGHGCRGGSLTLGKKIGDLYSAIATVKTAGSAVAAGDDIMQVELAPDEYHVINVACGAQSGMTVTTVALGRKEGGSVFGFGGEYRQSFATFQLQAGEILNVGSLLVLTDVAGGAHITVSDLPAASLQRLRKTKPNLAALMRTRLMTVPRRAQPAEEKVALCATIQQVRAATNVSGPLPLECIGAAARSPALDPARLQP